MGKRTSPKPWNMPGRKGTKRKTTGTHLAHTHPKAMPVILGATKPAPAPEVPEQKAPALDAGEGFSFDEPKKLTRGDLEAMGMKELRVIGVQFEAKGRTKASLIEQILDAQ